jgi:hypothetical protein
MPEISRFYGIVIHLYYGDHEPAHFHVSYSEYSAKVDIETLAVLEGDLPARALGLVIEWATLRRVELREAFQKASALEQPLKIAPLS